jgi:N-acetylmuramoyl-L-alanine amidase
MRKRRRGRARPSLLVAAILVAVVAAAMVLAPRFAGRLAKVAPAVAPSTYSVAVKQDDLPQGLETGACVAMRPLQGDRHTTVFVDPGHGGADPGASGSTSAGGEVDEKDVTLKVGVALTRRLRQDGYTVVMSRTGDHSVARIDPSESSDGTLTPHAIHLDGIARVACANAAQAKVLISIHFNSYADASVGGAETVYGDDRPFTESSKQLATSVQSRLLAQFESRGWQVPDRGITGDSDAGGYALTREGQAYGHLLELGPARPGWLDHASAMPGVLVEPLFLSRPSEADVAADPAEQAAMAAGLAAGVEQYLAPPRTSSPSPVPT